MNIIHSANNLNAQRKNLRKQLREQRNSLDEQTQINHAFALAHHFKNSQLFRRSKHIAAYLSADGEIDPVFIIEMAWQLNKKVYLPVLSPFANRLYFAPFVYNSKMKLNRFQIEEPDIHPKYWIKPHQLDLIFMPLVGFDKSGNRLGMGGGFYDRSLHFCHYRKNTHRPHLIGLAHQLQQVDQLQHQSHDVPVQYIATEQQLHDCK